MADGPLSSAKTKSTTGAASAWWLNLEANPSAMARLARHHSRPVHARAAAGEQRDRLWRRWVEIDSKLDTYAGRRSTDTLVVVLEPLEGTA